jgi:hypothetical protein
VGRLKLDTWGLKYATADSEISATVELNYLQLFTHSTVYHFLDCLAYFLGSDTRANFDRQKAHIDHDLGRRSTQLKRAAAREVGKLRHQATAGDLPRGLDPEGPNDPRFRRFRGVEEEATAPEDDQAISGSSEAA